MAATGRRKITVTFFGDLGGASPGHAQEIDAADSTDVSPAQVQLVTLAAGDNTITAPTGGSTPKACTIVKPSSNEAVLKLKGHADDVGIQLHKTDPDSVSIDGVSSFILNAASEVVGVRLFWT
jgi:hypothetical protein